MHPVFSRAFTAFGNQHASLHHGLGPEVTKAGSGVTKGANVLSDGQNESTAAQQESLGSAQQTQTQLNRQLTG